MIYDDTLDVLRYMFKQKEANMRWFFRMWRGFFHAMFRTMTKKTFWFLMFPGYIIIYLMARAYLIELLR